MGDETAVTHVQTSPAGALPPDHLERYRQVDLLGRGGMGEVRLCRDGRIGRDVALKVELKHSEDSRFLREALVQAQLEHPAIVPVYDVGSSGDALYFTMKCVRGKTLREIVHERREGKASTITQHKLIAAIAQVCLAVEFAHVRGVVHRDLKPANVMLGEWGEVYVLDWGIAKVAGDEEPHSRELRTSDPRIESTGPKTAEGSLIGTAGYMAPEQIDGRATPASDIYALGAILFEVLTLERLHVGGALSERISSTVLGDHGLEERGSKHDVAPELIAICEHATRIKPSDRFPSARALHDALERYLEGDRDTELRHTMAERHAGLGETLAREEKRAAALRELGRALALDPKNGRALATLVNLLKTPPAETPPDLEADLVAEREEEVRMEIRTGRRGLAFLLTVPAIALILGIRSYPLLVIYLGFFALLVTINMIAERGDGVRWRFPAVFAFLGMILVTGRLFGPLILAPGLLAAVCASFGIGLKRHTRYFVLAPLAALAVVGPMVLEGLGAISKSYVVSGDQIVIVPHLATFGPHSVPFLTIVTIFEIVMPIVLVGRITDEFLAAKKKLAVQEWQFRQLAPKDARPDA